MFHSPLREEDMKNSVLSQILEQNARARCESPTQTLSKTSLALPYPLL